MQLHILKTDIDCPRKIQVLQTILHQHPAVSRWSIDTEDIDNVLRVEADQPLPEQQLIQLVENQGFHCEPLPD